MSQMPLPFDELARQPAPLQAVPAGAAPRHEKKEESDDESNSSEEKVLEVSALEGRTPTARSAGKRHGCSSSAPPAGHLQHRPWPAGLTWEDALSYSSLSASQLRRWERSGSLTFRRIGRNGAKVVLRAQLDRLLETTFVPTDIDIAEDFDFG